LVTSVPQSKDGLVRTITELRMWLRYINMGLSLCLSILIENWHEESYLFFAPKLFYFVKKQFVQYSDVNFNKKCTENFKVSHEVLCLINLQLTGGLESTGDTRILTKRYTKQSLNTHTHPKENSLLTLT